MQSLFGTSQVLGANTVRGGLATTVPAVQPTRGRVSCSHQPANTTRHQQHRALIRGFQTLVAFFLQQTPTKVTGKSGDAASFGPVDE